MGVSKLTSCYNKLDCYGNMGFEMLNQSTQKLVAGIWKECPRKVIISNTETENAFKK